MSVFVMYVRDMGANIFPQLEFLETKLRSLKNNTFIIESVNDYMIYIHI